MAYGLKITGKIKVYKNTSESGYTFFKTILQSNKDYKTKEKLVLYSFVIFKQKDIAEMIEDGDTIEIIGNLQLAKSNYKGRDIEINLYVEQVLGFENNNKVINNSSNTSYNDYYLDDTYDINEDVPF